MVAKIKETEVAGVVTPDGRCPSCSATLIVQDRGYKFIKKNQGIAEFDNGEEDAI